MLGQTQAWATRMGLKPDSKVRDIVRSATVRGIAIDAVAQLGVLLREISRLSHSG
jgi:hypothetical protein